MEKQNYVLYRKFNLTLISAANLPNVRTYFKPKMYAKVSFCGDKKTEQRMRAEKHGQLNPAWNYTMKYKIDESGITHSGLQLVIKLYCKRTLGDRYVGEIHTSVKELFDYADKSGGSATSSLPIMKGSAETGGVLKFSYKFGEKIQKKKPGFVKRILLPGACILLRVAGAITLGVVIPVSFDAKHNIVEKARPTGYCFTEPLQKIKKPAGSGEKRKNPFLFSSKRKNRAKRKEKEPISPSPSRFYPVHIVSVPPLLIAAQCRFRPREAESGA